MGLLLGASIVSVVEALDYFLLRIFFKKAPSYSSARRKSDHHASNGKDQQPEITVVGKSSYMNGTSNVLMSDFKTMNY